MTENKVNKVVVINPVVVANKAVNALDKRVSEEEDSPGKEEVRETKNQAKGDRVVTILIGSLAVANEVLARDKAAVNRAAAASRVESRINLKGNEKIICRVTERVVLSGSPSPPSLHRTICSVH
jgi:hypothetical protein